jgi:hypothetical protein
MNNDELNLKLAKWVNLKNPHIIGDMIIFSDTINGEELNNLFTVLFTESLDSCFLYLIKKLEDKDPNLKIEFQKNGVTLFGKMSDRHELSYTIIGSGLTKTLALCDAVNNIMDEKKVS